MATVTSVTKHFPSAKESFTTTLASTISSGATTVPLNSVTGYNNGEVVALTVEPGSATNKQVFTGVVDTAGVQITGVVWTEGTNMTHNAGSTVVDYVAATHMSMVTKGLLAAGLTQAGGMGAISPTSVTSTGTITAANFVQTGGASANGWTVGLTVPNTVTALGNHSYSCVINSTDLTSQVSAGMRLKFTRTVAAPTQCTSLNGTTQYYSKTSPAGMTFTNNFVVSAWIKLSSYPSSTGVISSRYNGTSGWDFGIDSSGRVFQQGKNGGAANVNSVTSYQSVPLNKWVHVAAELDMSTSTLDGTHSWVMIDGTDVPGFKTSGGTNPTALIQAGNLEIGSENGGTVLFPGKIAQCVIYNAKVTQATILASMNQAVSGAETSVISAYSFNNSINDLNANANNLTANGSAVATNADSPFGGQADGTISSTVDYGIITKTAFSTNTTLTVQVPEGCTIPTSGGVSAVSYSTQKIPYLFPLYMAGSVKLGDAYIRSNFTTTSTSLVDVSGLTTTVTAPTNCRLNIKVQTYNIASSQAAGQGVTLALLEDGVIIGSQIFTTPVAGYAETPSINMPWYPTSGSHTYKVQVQQAAAGTLTVAAGATTPMFIEVVADM